MRKIQERFSSNFMNLVIDKMWDFFYRVASYITAVRLWSGIELDFVLVAMMNQILNLASSVPSQCSEPSLLEVWVLLMGEVYPTTKTPPICQNPAEVESPKL